MIAGGRPINYLRISVTDRCNFRCRYCVTSSEFSVISHDHIARYEEIMRITRLACELGITKVRITGGEPFVRKGIFDFLEDLCALPQLKDVSITTNGALLSEAKVQRLVDMGIKRLNFSLDTLKPDRFKTITGRDRFSKVWDAIMAAHDKGIAPVKINAVAMRGTNDDELADLAGLSRDYPFHIRFIEYMPMGDDPMDQQQQILSQEIRERIEAAHGELTPMAREATDGPAKKYQLPGAKGVVGFITPISSHFCSQCNRLRLTSRGTLRPCLLNNYEKEILAPLRDGASDDQLKQIIESALAHKPAHHDLSQASKSPGAPISHMTSIGG